ncbi:hypothetical protein CB0940_05975 [Cercospora beticola]|uniref:Uncharacterized protein n=1 Tax=Cercospora beticola TaxID=122368 RepID=A0A2G5I0J1_CERBT|nr:hypothetical protein CB0940_05975 [Cercospora beticola]PIA98012.1 hypothetical protein CB0940_05975 [Cercospora beticola]WPA98577.1 hypothetical protein RHO25_003189 [Cercospora beticola]CAK1359839.1 unnamed protein product [Cercospora beticola]
MGCVRRVFAVLSVFLSATVIHVKASDISGVQPSDAHLMVDGIATEVVSVAQALTITVSAGATLTPEPIASAQTLIDTVSIDLGHGTTLSLDPGVTIDPVPEATAPSQQGLVVVTVLQTVTRTAHSGNEAQPTERREKRFTQCWNGSAWPCGVPTTTYTDTYPPWVFILHGETISTIYHTTTTNGVVWVASMFVNEDTEVHHPATTITGTRYSYYKRDLASASTSASSTTTTTAYISTVVITIPEPSSSTQPTSINFFNGTISTPASSEASANTTSVPYISDATSTFLPSSFSSEAGASYFTKINPIATVIQEICKINGTCYPLYNTSAVTANPNFTIPLTAFSANLTTTAFTFVSPTATTTSKSTSALTSSTLGPSTTRNLGGEQNGGAAGNSACAFLTGLMVLAAIL